MTSKINFSGRCGAEAFAFTFFVALLLATTIGPVLGTFMPGSSNQALAAEDLKLKKGVSFNDDSDNGFPIEGTHMDDTALDPGRVTFIFYGASGDLNTNRQAKRLVDLYKTFANKAVKFIVVDVDHPINAGATALIKNHYKGYIPFEVLLDKGGKVAWSQIGEVENGILNQQVERVLAQ